MSTAKKFIGFIEDKQVNDYTFKNVSFSPTDLENMLKVAKAGKGWVNITISKSKSGKEYMTIYDPNNVVPSPEGSSTKSTSRPQHTGGSQSSSAAENSSSNWGADQDFDMPF